MKNLRYLWITLLLICICVEKSNAITESPSDTVLVVTKKKSPRFIGLNTMGGIVLATNDYIKEGKTTSFVANSLKYGIYSTGENWQDMAYGMPYYGIGIYNVNFFNKKGLGHPLSVFLFQGADLATFSNKWSLKYELNLGLSFNWKYYDAFDNPDNIAIGSSSNAHLGANVYLNGKLSPYWNLHLGFGLTHFSNGAMQLPNKGLNMASPFIELVYNLNSEPTRGGDRKSASFPKQETRIDHDILVTTTTRQIRLDTLGTGLPTRLLDKNFRVLGVSYATMFVHNYKYKWGPSVEFVYDESSGVNVWREEHPEDGQFYDRIKLGKSHDRFSLGISAKGEITLPYMTYFANFGVNLLHGNDYDYRVYQILGVKAYLKDDFFATFGIRAGKFSKAQYLFWSIGYTIKGKPYQKGKDKFIHRILP